MRRVLPFALALGLLFPATGSAGHIEGCNTRSCDERVKRACWKDDACRARVVRKQWHRVADPYWGIFQAIAECESHGNWGISTGNGYYGGIQFALRSWQAVGGRGYPHHASKLEQIYRGVRLMRLQGWNAWPRCRYAAGV